VAPLCGESNFGADIGSGVGAGVHAPRISNPTMSKIPIICVLRILKNCSLLVGCLSTSPPVSPLLERRGGMGFEGAKPLQASLDKQPATPIL